MFLLLAVATLAPVGGMVLFMVAIGAAQDLPPGAAGFAYAVAVIGLPLIIAFASSRMATALRANAHQ